MIKFTLRKTLNELDITRNKLAVEAKVRPNTINDMVNGDIHRMDLQTLSDIIDTLNLIAIENRMEKRYDINDIMEYEMNIQQRLF
jgi:DNA-binding Xre family transcriptional regulator